jgi:hypothetical protein
LAYIFQENEGICLSRESPCTSPGEDSIIVELFKCTSQEFVIRFLRFLNDIWNGEEHPECWLKAVLTPMHKKGNITQHENCR